MSGVAAHAIQGNTPQSPITRCVIGDTRSEIREAKCVYETDDRCERSRRGTCVVPSRARSTSVAVYRVRRGVPKNAADACVEGVYAVGIGVTTLFYTDSVRRHRATLQRCVRVQSVMGSRLPQPGRAHGRAPPRAPPRPQRSETQRGCTPHNRHAAYIHASHDGTCIPCRMPNGSCGRWAITTHSKVHLPRAHASCG